MNEPSGQMTDRGDGSGLLKKTTSRCPVCHVSCPAEVRLLPGSPDSVVLERQCPVHGPACACIATDARFYWLAKGRDRGGCRGDGDQGEGGGGCCGGGCGGGEESEVGECSSASGGNKGTLGRNADPGQDAVGVMEKLSTCLCLIEIVNSCNLPCPTCYAGSPLGQGRRVDSVPIEDIKSRVNGVIERKGGIEILQLSGGEPTLHPDFFELLEWAQSNPGIDYILLNTNGVRIAGDSEFAEKLGRSFRYGKFQLYLQFDGVQEEGQKFLRGADMRKTREKALERCLGAGIPITLAMTVTPENLPFLWETIEYGLRWSNVRGVSFQPMFGSGRVPESGKTARRLNAADIILSAVEGSGGKLRPEDFTPLPCGDPNCATIGYLLKVGGEVRSVSDFVDFSNLQGFLGTKVRYKLEDLMKCGCDSEPLGELLKQFELDETHTFRIFIKPFMDAWSWDDDRIDRCCTHVIRPDGKLDSFCRYYSGFGR